ncbi:MAG: hypothetical protein ACI4E1_07185 [Lachnospira sp.]
MITGNYSMSRADTEALKRRIRANLAQKQGVNPNNNLNRVQNHTMATLNPDEFHPETMVAGSTGEYRDMKGGTRFDYYDCGHEYDDSVIRNKPVQTDMAHFIRRQLQDPDSLKSAVIMSEIMQPRHHRRHRF